MIHSYFTACLRFLLKLGVASQTLSLAELNFKLQQPENYELNTLTYSNYRNMHAVGKIWLEFLPKEQGQYSVNYIVDQYLTLILYKNLILLAELTRNMNHIRERISHPKYLQYQRCLLKMIQFLEAKLAANSDIAATSIHVERFRGLVY